MVTTSEVPLNNGIDIPEVVDIGNVQVYMRFYLRDIDFALS